MARKEKPTMKHVMLYIYWLVEKILLAGVISGKWLIFIDGQ